MLKKVCLFMLLAFVTQSVFASCFRLIQQQNDALKTAAQVFPTSDSLFTVVTCKSSSPSMYEVLYTQLQERNKNVHNAPSGGLSKLKLPVDPNGRNRSTGIVVADPDKSGRYTLKLRTRMATGEEIDISRTVALQQGQSSIFTEKGITIGFSRLPTK